MNKFISEVTNEDCMEGMARYPDKYFDLAIVDPPYGININESIGRRKGKKHSGYKKVKWDNEIPSSIYFIELFRVSKNQIIWGGNYMTDFLDPSPCWLIWDKMQEFSGSVFEMAWTSFTSPAKAFRMSRVEAYTNGNKIHPTQKPVALYKWLLHNYAKKGDKILDTHLGSGSSRIAAYEMGFDFTAFELDAEYFEAQEKRYKAHIAQLKLELI
jgi:site-specific DNA-methyltransferase (adenine-specific)